MASPVARAGADLRMLRAAVFTAVCVVLSAAGHVLASCATVPLWTVGVGCAAVFTVALTLAGRERSLPGIAALLAIGQLALHTLFALGQHRASAAEEAAQRADAAQGHIIGLAARLLCTSGPGRLDAATAHRIVAHAGLGPSAAHSPHTMPSSAAPAERAAGMAGLLPSLPMTLGHLLAALAIGWLLRRGEMAVWRAVRLSVDGARGVAEAALVRALRAALKFVRVLLAPSGAPYGGPCRPRTADRDEGGTTALALQHSVIRRGPPACDLAA
ncbi:MULTISPECIES: hypothetical protein [Streptomyces]|uniref:hypothetical protein n=1 Tax=Streptomyces TaxID=1883 RepID=UPI000F78C71F|nr:hypothetical protein [Streptomyces sp. WAC05858]RSS48017.1 hypothetical protein EF902_07150 [Streptomyces sp. WAC05858]WTA82717.1 hypothetical protein OG751_24040 [Streptomyces antimycoticus]